MAICDFYPVLIHHRFTMKKPQYLTVSVFGCLLFQKKIDNCFYSLFLRVLLLQIILNLFCSLFGHLSAFYEKRDDAVLPLSVAHCFHVPSALLALSTYVERLHRLSVCLPNCRPTIDPSSYLPIRVPYLLVCLHPTTPTFGR